VPPRSQGVVTRAHLPSGRDRGRTRPDQRPSLCRRRLGAAPGVARRPGLAVDPTEAWTPLRKSNRRPRGSAMVSMWLPPSPPRNQHPIWHEDSTPHRHRRPAQAPREDKPTHGMKASQLGTELIQGRFLMIGDRQRLGNGCLGNRWCPGWPSRALGRRIAGDSRGLPSLTLTGLPGLIRPGTRTSTAEPVASDQRRRIQRYPL
jgi:hypothetical protein